MCLKNYLCSNKQDISTNISVPEFKIYRNVDLPSEFSNYWKLLFADDDVEIVPNVNPNKDVDTDTYTDTDTHTENISIVTIGGEECYTTLITMGDILLSNLFDPNSSFPIEPLDRLNMVCVF